MNTDRSTSSADHFKSLQILDELSNNDSLTQRDLSSRLGIALGLVNSYIKNLAAKGFITVKAIPPKRYTYYLTPKGFAEKTRLTYRLLQDYTRIYREAKNSLKKMFYELEREGSQKIVFAGVDEVAEIAYITLQETSMKLASVIDTEKIGEQFFGREIEPFSSLQNSSYDCVVVTSYLKRDKIYQELLEHGVAKKTIRTYF